MIPEPTETGRLGVCGLKRSWARLGLQRQGLIPFDRHEFHRGRLVWDALGVGLEQTLPFLGQNAPTFEAFEQWILDTTGGISPERIARINAALTGTALPPEAQARLDAIQAMDPVLSNEDLAFWDENGYVVVRDAVPAETRDAARDAVLDHVGAELNNPDSWYTGRKSIMVQYFQHPAFDANRYAPRIHKAFAQIWGSADLWVTTDRVGFNVPERPGWNFQGPDLHFDVSLAQPMPLGTHGILYLTDTEAEQGAFTLVPGFHRRVADWLVNLSAGANPRDQDLHALGSKPIAGRAGDFIIWHDALPHGSRPNRATMPRIVQYIAMYPMAQEIAEEWV